MVSLGRSARLIRSGLGTSRGGLVVLGAVLGVVAVVTSDLGAMVVGVISVIALATVMLLVIGRRRTPKGKPEHSPGAIAGPAAGMDTSLETAIRSSRQRLAGVAAALGLEPPRNRAGPPSAQPHAIRPLITVVVPVHNDEKYIEAALQSIRLQSYPHWECIIVDDASDDASVQLIESAVGSDARFRLIRHEVNQGPGAARNTGLAEARGSHLAFLDADDLLLRESLSDRVQAISERQPDPFLAGSFCAVRFGPEDVILDDLPDRRHVTQPDFVDFVSASGECPFTMIAPLVSTEVVRKAGGFDESMRSGGVDWDLWYRILRNGWVFVPSRSLGAVYRQRGGGITRGKPAAHTEAAARLILAAYRNADPAILSIPSPYPMPDPLPDYQARLTIAERAIRFASMALIDGDRPGMRSTLAVLESGSWYLLDRHLDLPSLVTRGAARVLGVRPKHLDGLEDELAPFVVEVETAVRRVTG